MSKKNSPTLNSNETVELTIDSLSYFGGRGVGRFDGIVVFVPGTAPGDRVRARVTAKKPRLWEAELVEVLEPSTSRRQPPCPVAGRCGGCSWQHIEYSEQVQQKIGILKASMRSLAKYGEFEFRQFVAAPEEFGYRNRIQVHSRGGAYGFYAMGTRDLVPVKHCLIAEDKVNEALAKLSPTANARTEIALLESGEVSVVEGERDPEAALFSQVNRAQNENLKRILIESIHGTPNWLMDLYAGSGNLTTPLFEHFPTAEIFAAEMSRSAVERGQEALPKVVWKAGDVERLLAQVKRRPGQGCVVLDPPRIGTSQKAVDEILRLGPQQILYVSCNPTTFARDAERFIRAGRYKVEFIQGLDMFPQTEHVELIASLCAAP